MSFKVEKVNTILEDFYKLFYKTEDMALKRGIKCLTHTELHIIESIGQSSLSMNELSEKLGITMGTATVAISKLNEKGFVTRERSKDDRRKVFVALTKKGQSALEYHNSFHDMIISSITENISKKDLEHFSDTFEVILETLKTKTDFFKPRLISEFPEGSRVSIVEIKGTPLVQKFFLGHGIMNFSKVTVLTNDNKNSLSLETKNGNVLDLDILDAKNLVAIKSN